MSDMVPEVLNAALDSLFTPKEPGEQEYQGEDGLLYCRSCHTPVQCRVKLWGRDKIVPCLCRCQQEAMAEKKRQDELVERQRKIRQLKATGIQEKHLLEWNFAVAEDNKDIQMANLHAESLRKPAQGCDTGGTGNTGQLCRLGRAGRCLRRREICLGWRI